MRFVETIKSLFSNKYLNWKEVVERRKRIREFEEKGGKVIK